MADKQIKYAQHHYYRDANQTTMGYQVIAVKTAPKGLGMQL